MGKKTRTTLLTGMALALSFAAASALAGPLRGVSYVGNLPTSGVANYHHLHMRIHTYGGQLVLKVAGNGRTVTARFTTSHPFMFCNVSELLRSQSTHPASISSSGS